MDVLISASRSLVVSTTLTPTSRAIRSLAEILPKTLPFHIQFAFNNLSSKLMSLLLSCWLGERHHAQGEKTALMTFKQQSRYTLD